MYSFDCCSSKKAKELRKVEGECYDNRLSPKKYSEERAFYYNLILRELIRLGMLETNAS